MEYKSAIKKIQITAMCNNLAEFQNHFVEWKKTQKRTNCMNPFIWNSRIGHSSLWWKKIPNIGCLRNVGAGIDWERTCQDDGNVLILDRVLVTQVYVYFQICQMRHLRFVHFIICKFDLIIKKLQTNTNGIHTECIFEMHQK